MSRSSAPTTLLEPTSKHFLARLGSPDSALVERLERWAATSCEDYAMHRGEEDGSLIMFVNKGQAKTVQQMQALLRALCSNWKMTFGKLSRGWVCRLEEAEYKAAVEGAVGREVALACEGAKAGVDAQCRVPGAAVQAPSGVNEFSKASPPSEVPASAGRCKEGGTVLPIPTSEACGVRLMRLSHGFDKHSRMLLAAMNVQTVY